MVHVAQVAQTLQVLYNKWMHIFKGTGLSEQEDGTVGHFPQFFGPREAVVHATAASFELRCKGATTVKLIILVLQILNLLLFSDLIVIMTMAMTILFSNTKLGDILQVSEFLTLAILLFCFH